MASYGAVPSPPPEIISYCPVGILYGIYCYMKLSHSFMSSMIIFCLPSPFYNSSFYKSRRHESITPPSVLWEIMMDRCHRVSVKHSSRQPKLLSRQPVHSKHSINANSCCYYCYHEEAVSVLVPEVHVLIYSSTNPKTPSGSQVLLPHLLTL